MPSFCNPFLLSLGLPVLTLPWPLASSLSLGPPLLILASAPSLGQGGLLLVLRRQRRFFPLYRQK